MPVYIRRCHSPRHSLFPPQTAIGSCLPFRVHCCFFLLVNSRRESHTVRTSALDSVLSGSYGHLNVQSLLSFKSLPNHPRKSQRLSTQ